MSKPRIKKLVLHAGLPKTATSALQLWLRRNRSSLHKVGIDYPDRHPVGGNKHSFVVNALRTGDLSELANVIADRSCDTILLSDEGLSNHFHDFSRATLAEFREKTSRIEKEIILVTREPAAWLRSYHKQCVINPDNGASDLWGTSLRQEDIRNHPRIRRLTDHDRLLSDMVLGFGAGSARRLSFENDWFGSLINILGLSSLPLARPEKINESIPDWAIELMRQINLRNLPGDQRRPWKAVLQKYTGSSHSILTGSIVSSWAEDVRSLDRSILDDARRTADFRPSSEYRHHLEGFSKFIANSLGSVDRQDSSHHAKIHGRATE